MSYSCTTRKFGTNVPLEAGLLGSKHVEPSRSEQYASTTIDELGLGYIQGDSNCGMG